MSTNPEQGVPKAVRDAAWKAIRAKGRMIRHWNEEPSNPVVSAYTDAALAAVYPDLRDQVLAEALSELEAMPKEDGIAREFLRRSTIRKALEALTTLSPSEDTTEEPIPRSYWREVPCGHPSDPVAMFGREGEPVCHCGSILDQQGGIEIDEAPGPVVHCQQCGCGVAIPPRPPEGSGAPLPEAGCKHVDDGFSCSGVEDGLKAEADRLNAQFAPDHPSWTSIRGADAYRRSQGHPAPVTARCRECGAPEGAHHGPDCVTGNSRKTSDRVFTRPVTAADCQSLPEGEKCEFCNDGVVEEDDEYQRPVDRPCEYCHGTGKKPLPEALHDLKFGTHTYTPEQAEVVGEAVENRKPLPEAPRCGSGGLCYRTGDGEAHDEAFRCAGCERPACGYCATPSGDEWLCPDCPPDCSPEPESVDGEEARQKLDWPARCKGGGEVRILRCPVCGRLTVDWPEVVRGVRCFDDHAAAGDYEVVKRFNGPAATAVWALFQASQLATDEEWQGEILSRGASLRDAIGQRVDVALADIAASPDTQDSDRGLGWLRKDEGRAQEIAEEQIGQWGGGWDADNLAACARAVLDALAAASASRSTDAEGKKP